MKKLLLLSFSIFLIGCGTSAFTTNTSNEIHLFNWGLFLEPELLDIFYEETGINVITSEYESNEAMYARFTAGTDLFDIMIPSDYMVSRLINEGLLRPINFDNIPNMEHIDTQLLNRNFDISQRYSVPYKWGTLGILYNTTMINHDVTSWDSLFNPNYAGQILMYNSERDAFAVALSRLGYSINTTNIEHINAARDMLISQLPLVQAYVTDTVMSMMVDGEAALALVYSGDASWSILSNPDLNYVIPEEGSNLWINSLVIPHNAPNPEGAEKFINFLLRPDIAARNTDWVGYTTANFTAREQGLINPELTSLASFDISPEDYNRLEVFVDLGEYRELITNAFTQVLASN
ncbi:MAG: ABC transporter substrate-binding protein [Defluviitaleaceae bacterium]|nr:ABC transporter substrate-binding protein [Defluviitaleaceae bacterium]